jgi:hypothetical protein
MSLPPLTMPSRTTLQVYRGDTIRIMTEVIDEDTGQPVVLDPYVVRFTMKRTVGDPDDHPDAIRKSTRGDEGGGVQTSGNIATIILAPEDTVNFPDITQRFVWDIQIVQEDTGAVYTVDAGDIMIVPDVTRIYSGL